MLRILFASANASAHFALACLEPTGDGSHLRAKSSFVDPDGAIMHWHEFGDLEGPGWAANAVGGAHLLTRWGAYLGDASIQERALGLLDHVLADGFVREDGFITPYRDLAQNRFCLNYAHNDDWLCPGSLAKIGVQMLAFADEIENAHRRGGHGTADATGKIVPGAGALRARVAKLKEVAHNLSDWLAQHVPLLENGWVPRRITIEGEAYALSPHGLPDSIYDHSADGLFLMQLWAATGKEDLARRLGDAFVSAGGLWGSINHDTFDDHENVAYAVAFRLLHRWTGERGPAWRDFAYQVALPAMERFRMAEDHNGVVTRGLFWMEESWDTAYLWENAEVAQAHLEAWLDRGEEAHLEVALGVLKAIAHHHYGSLGFLTEGVDWNDHVGQQHHVRRAPYGAIQYTEPLLNNLHLIGPTLTLLRQAEFAPPADLVDPRASIETVCALSNADCTTVQRISA
jgi:hypothetical protein